MKQSSFFEYFEWIDNLYRVNLSNGKVERFKTYNWNKSYMMRTKEQLLKDGAKQVDNPYEILHK